MSVVICVYTEERWDDILAAVDSVRGQSLPAHETLLVVDHNPALLRRLAAYYGDGDAGAAGREEVREKVRVRVLAAYYGDGDAGAAGREEVREKVRVRV
ncbi:hypothetical protein AB4212_45815, partial [Streptomyces sp. 2MCAF27]